MKIKFHLSFQDRTLINGEMFFPLLLLLFSLFPGNQTVLEEPSAGSLIFVLLHIPRWGQIPEAVGFNVDKLQEKLCSLVGCFFLFCEFVFENLKQTKKSKKNLPQGTKIKMK